MAAKMLPTRIILTGIQSVNFNFFDLLSHVSDVIVVKFLQEKKISLSWARSLPLLIILANTSQIFINSIKKSHNDSWNSLSKKWLYICIQKVSWPFSQEQQEFGARVPQLMLNWTNKGKISTYLFKYHEMSLPNIKSQCQIHKVKKWPIHWNKWYFVC